MMEDERNLTKRIVHSKAKKHKVYLRWAYPVLFSAFKVSHLVCVQYVWSEYGCMFYVIRPVSAIDCFDASSKHLTW